MDLNELLSLEQIALLNADHAGQPMEKAIHVELAAYYAARVHDLRRSLRVPSWSRAKFAPTRD